MYLGDVRTKASQRCQPKQNAASNKLSLAQKPDAARNLSAKASIYADVKLFNLKITKVFLKILALRKCSQKCRIRRKTLYYTTKCTNKESACRAKKACD